MSWAVSIIISFICCQWSLTPRPFHFTSSMLSPTMHLNSSHVFSSLSFHTRTLGSNFLRRLFVVNFSEKKACWTKRQKLARILPSSGKKLPIDWKWSMKTVSAMKLKSMIILYMYIKVNLVFACMSVCLLQCFLCIASIATVFSRPRPNLAHGILTCSGWSRQGFCTGTTWCQQTWLWAS